MRAGRHRPITTRMQSGACPGVMEVGMEEEVMAVEEEMEEGEEIEQDSQRFCSSAQILLSRSKLNS